MDVGTVPPQAPVGGFRGRVTPLTKDASDADLVAQIRAGSSAAFEALDARYRAAILHYCRQLLADRDEAEDAVQHTFLAAYTSIVASDGDIEVRPWLYVIARNRCYSILRSRREVTVAELDHGTSEEPATLVERREDLRDLVLDVSRLPEDQRAALVMAEFGARSHDEIAGVLEVPRSKVKALVFQARESLVATRAARETDCADIRRQLRTVRGGGLRRGTLRRHLHECAGCREYRRQLRVQRARFAGFLPLAPWFGLRSLLARSAPGGSAPVAGGAGTASAAIKVGALKPLAGALAAMLSAASAVVAVHSMVPSHPVAHARPAAHRAIARPGVHGRTSAQSTLTGHHVVLRVAGAHRGPAHHGARSAQRMASARLHSAGAISRTDRLALTRAAARRTASLRSRLIVSRPHRPAARVPSPAPSAPPATSGHPAAPLPAPLPVALPPELPISFSPVTPPLLVHGHDRPAPTGDQGSGDGLVSPGHDALGSGDKHGTATRDHGGSPTDQPSPPAVRPKPARLPLALAPAPADAPAPKPADAPAPKPAPPGHRVAPGHTSTPPARPVTPPRRVPVHSGSTS